MFSEKQTWQIKNYQEIMYAENEKLKLQETNLVWT